MKASDIVGLLKSQYSGPEWGCFEELRAGTGAWHNQRLDLYAMNLWPSNHWRSLAFEVKVSRSDFMHEIRDPGKRLFAESVARECYFCTPLGLVKLDEVPEGWGLMEVTAGGARTKKAATQRAIPQLPMPFVAAIARRCADPEGRAKKKAWLLAGKELDEDALLEIAKEAMGTHDDNIRKSARRQGELDLRESADYKAMAALRDAAGAIVGRWHPTDNDLREWVAGHAGLDARTRDRLRDCHKSIGALLASAEEGA